MATGKSFRCRLITPVAQILDEQAVSAVVPAWDGLFGVLPNRAPIVAKLGLGELQIKFADTDKGKGGARSFLVEDGFVQMVDNKLTILAAKAIPTESLSEQDAQAELREANARRPDKAGDSQRLAADKARAQAKIRLAQKASGRGI